jgi:MFS superfamily sulfate permease-like transporter
MDSMSTFSVVWRFILKILVLDMAMAGLAGLASTYGLNFGIILLALGCIIGGIGALRGGPASIDSLYTRLILKNWHRPFNQPSDQRTFIIENSVSTYSFENVMASAGLIAILLGILLVVSSK